MLATKEVVIVARHNNGLCRLVTKCPRTSIAPFLARHATGLARQLDLATGAAIIADKILVKPVWAVITVPATLMEIGRLQIAATVAL